MDCSDAAPSAPPQFFRGIIPPLVTPLLNGEKLDASGLHRVIDRVLAERVQGVFLLGSTGEAPSLSLDIRRALINETCAIIAGRVPVLVSVSDTAFTHSLQLANQAAQAGACAVVLSPPCYFPLDQEALFRTVHKFAESSPLPVLLYNIPQYAHSELEPGTVGRLSKLENIIGIKNSNGSLDYLRAVRQAVAHRPGFSVLVGNEEKLFPALLAGADGGICGGANMFPDLYVHLYEAFARGDRAEAESLHNLVVRVADLLYTIGPAETSYLRGLKCALSLLRVIDNVLAEPLPPFDETQRAELEARLNQILETLNSPGIQSAH